MMFSIQFQEINLNKITKAIKKTNAVYWEDEITVIIKTINSYCVSNEFNELSFTVFYVVLIKFSCHDQSLRMCTEKQSWYN